MAYIDKLNLIRLVLHNLAVINYCEILDYNERLQEQIEQGLTQDSTLNQNLYNSPETLKQLERIDEEKH